MSDKKYHPVADMFAREDEEKIPYEIRAFKSTYVILPGVFSPKVRGNSLWYAKKIPPILSGSSFLEIGAGAGILAIEAAKRGYKVTATDIDPQAVKNTKLNAKKHKIAVAVRLGDVFKPLKKGERFDTIFWNHPWIYADKKVSDRYGFSFDYHYLALKKFINNGKDHLTKTGQILLGTGGLARVDLIAKWAQAAGYKIELKCREIRPLSPGKKFKTDFLIYSLQPTNHKTR